MPGQKRSVEVFKALAEELGIETLARIHANSVRDRPPPERLLARLWRKEDTKLTDRQREVMVLIASGYTQQETADELGLTLHTIKTHMKSIYRKLGVHNRVEAVNAFVEEAA